MDKARQNAIDELRRTIRERQKRFPTLISQGKIDRRTGEMRISGLIAALRILDPGGLSFTGRSKTQNDLFK